MDKWVDTSFQFLQNSNVREDLIFLTAGAPFVLHKQVQSFPPKTGNST